MPGRITVASQNLVAVFLLLLSAPASGEAAEQSQAADRTFAQAGSTGGTLGNEEKSVSGTQAAPAVKKPPKVSEPARSVSGAHSAPPAKRPRIAVTAPIAPPPAPKAPKRQARESVASVAAYEGSWTGASTGSCIPRWRWSFTVINGIMTGDSGSNISGRIRPDGDTAGKMTVFGSTYDFIGQMSATRVSGTWVKLGEDGCTGTWSATK